MKPSKLQEPIFKAGKIVKKIHNLPLPTSFNPGKTPDIIFCYCQLYLEEVGNDKNMMLLKDRWCLTACGFAIFVVPASGMVQIGMRFCVSLYIRPSTLATTLGSTLLFRSITQKPYEIGVQQYGKKRIAIYCNMANPYCNTYWNMLCSTIPSDMWHTWPLIWNPKGNSRKIVHLHGILYSIFPRCNSFARANKWTNRNWLESSAPTRLYWVNWLPITRKTKYWL